MKIQVSWRCGTCKSHSDFETKEQSLGGQIVEARNDHAGLFPECHDPDLVVEIEEPFA